jgi:hypothetical protein
MALLEVVRQRHRIGASGSITRQINAPMIVQGPLAIGQAKIVTRHDISIGKATKLFKPSRSRSSGNSKARPWSGVLESSKSSFAKEV